MTKKTSRSITLPASLLLALCWFAVPTAIQDDATEGFIIFTSDRANPNNLGICGNCEDLYVMSADGTGVTRLTHGGGAPEDAAAYNSGGADWSHSKKLIAFQSNRVGRVPQIHVMNVDGSDQQLLVSVPGGAGFPSFSPTGNELCFHGLTAPRDIFIVTIDGTGLTNLTSPLPGLPGANGDNIRCDWSPKGAQITFTSSRDGNQEIYVIDADGADLRRLTDAAGSDANPTFSPKGDRIAFESNRDGLPEIYVMNADGSEPTRLTDFSAAPRPNQYTVTKPTWSPKGDRIAFHRRVGPQGMRGHLEVYTINADGTGVAQMTVTPSPGFSGFPSWGKWSAQHP